MTDVFISYSRKDISFARLLHSTLQQEQLVPWIDWERIPVGEKWWDEICSAIENANAFLFIISRNSIGSKVCKEEVDQALNHHKRIIPVIVDDTEISEIKKILPDLSEINWIAFREGDTFYLEERVSEDPNADTHIALTREPVFQETLQKLDEVIRVDWDRVSSHTRLEVKAGEWQSHNNESSYLLRSRDLQEAEQFLAESEGHDPTPTDLQRQLVLASRRRLERNRQIGLIAAGIALIAAVILSFFAYTARTEAAEQESNARVQAHNALLRQLAAQVRYFADNQTDLALLLGLELERQLNGEKWPSGSFLEVFDSNGQLRTYLQGQADGQGAISFSPDGKIFASAGCADPKSESCAGGEIHLWDASNPSELLPLGQPISGHSARITTIAFSPDGKLLATGSSDHSILLWDMTDPNATHLLAQTSTGHSEGINHIAFYPGGNVLASASDDKTVILWDISQPDELKMIASPLKIHSDKINKIAFSPDKSLMAIASDDRSVSFWDVRKINSPVEMGKTTSLYTGEVKSLSFSSDSHSLYTGTSNGSLVILDSFESGGVRYKTIDNLINGEIKDIVVASDKKSLLLLGSNKTIAVLESDDGDHWQRREIISENSPFPVTQMAVNPVRMNIISGGSDQKLIEWDILLDSEIPSRLTVNKFFINDLEPNGMAFHPKRMEIAISGCSKRPEGDSNCQESQTQRWDISNPLAPIRIGDPFASFSFWPAKPVYSPDGNILAIAGCDNNENCENGRISLWDVSNPQMTEPIGNKVISGSKMITSLQFSPDGKILASTSDDKMVILWDVSDRKNIQMIGQPSSGHQNSITSVCFTPDGKLLVTGDDKARIIHWDITDPKSPVNLIEWFSGLSDSITRMAISPDGKTLAVASADQTVSLNDISDPKKPKTFLPVVIKHDHQATSVIFSPNGKMVVTTGFDATVRLWDVTNLDDVTQIGLPLKEATSTSNDAAFSQDGKTLAVVGGMHSVIIHNLDQSTWSEKACKIANRNLTKDEWNMYMGVLPYHETCPGYGEAAGLKPDSTALP